jgi:hypothetical protein
MLINQFKTLEHTSWSTEASNRSQSGDILELKAMLLLLTVANPEFILADQIFSKRSIM